MKTKKQREEPRTHTPGPWRILADPVWRGKHPLHEARYVATSVEVECSRMGWRFVDDRASIICTMPDAENQQQNARLIAAAPELLAELLALVEIICGGERDVTLEDCDAAKAVIAKAKRRA